MRQLGFGIVGLLGALGGWAVEAQDKPADPEGVEFFEKKIRPVLADKCYSCHSETAKRLKAGLRLDTRDGVLKGGDTGPALKPGDPEASLLIKAIRQKDDALQMPPKEKLAPEVVADFEAWVRRGAPDPRTGNAAQRKSMNIAAARSHWAFQAPKAAPVPAVKRKDGVATPVDAFILQKLEEKGVPPAAPADRRTQLRRLTLDLTGLPPAPEEIDAFLADDSPDAWAKAVDRLLASPRFGERWGRFWLDVARYSDTKGYVFQEERRYAYSYTYRDWVIRAFNEDLPIDRFLMNQIAADRMVQGEDKRDLAALGFLTLGRRFLNRQPDIIDDRIDVVTRGMMGITVACARCHDHMFDPIPTKDYYSLYGVFASSQEPKNLPRIAETVKTADSEAYEKELAERQAEVTKFREEKHRTMVPALRTRDKLAAYFQGAAEAKDLNGDEGFRALAQKRDLSAYVLQRWRDRLRGAKDPVFAPWAAYAAIPEKDFAEKAKAVDLKSANPKVAAEFAKPPASLKEAAERYGALLAKHDADLPRTDAAEEALRLALRGTESPAHIPLADVEKIYTRAERDRQRQIEKKVEELGSTHPGAPPHAHAMEDLPRPSEPRVFVRGNPSNAGDAVPRQFLEILTPPGKREPFKTGSGRLDLAKAVASRENPLTARVFVNRVWLQLFGQGLVRTPSDYGVRTEPPAQPELLDWMAVRFMDEGWSVKKLIRLLVTSNVYRQSSEADPKWAAVDPDNRLLHRQNRKRLEFEAMRDSILAASGEIDLSMGGRPVPMVSNPTAKTRMEAETIKVDVGDPSLDSYSKRRTVYLFIDRQNLSGTYRVFDFASPDTHSPQRYQTTVPQQALYFMNSTFVVEQARALAGRADAKDPDARIAQLYRFAFGRAPSKDEAALARRFVDHEETREGVAQAAPAWRYGYGQVDETEKRVKSFTPLPHFTGMAWQGGAALPDAKLGWVLLTAQGGHPGGRKELSAIRRWTAPVDGAVTVSGTLAHKASAGDGVHARILSSALGELASWTAHNTDAETKLARIEVRKGDTIDFVVECRKDENSDGFSWAPLVRLEPAVVLTTGNTPLEYNAQAEFAGAPGKPRRPLTGWEKLAQVLLETNEFLFVD
jgi:hypothetical protein